MRLFHLTLLAVIMCSLITSIDPAPTAVYASSVGTTSVYDCRLNEYYPNECSLFLEGQPRGGLSACEGVDVDVLQCVNMHPRLTI